MKGRHGEKIDFRYNIKEYWKVLKKYKFLFFGLVILTFIAESTRTVEKFLFKTIIDNGTSFLAGTLLKNAFVKVLIIVAIIYFGTRIVLSVSKWFIHYVLSLLDVKIIIDIKRKYFDHIVDLDHNFHTTHRTGSMVSRMIRGAGAVESMTDIIAFDFVPLVVNVLV